MSPSKTLFLRVSKTLLRLSGARLIYFHSMQSLLQEISRLYGLELSFVEKANKGILTENYILADEVTKYFLKKYSFDNEARVQEVHSAKKWFSDNGVPVILPIKNSADTYFFFENAYYALFPFVLGYHIEQLEHTEVSVRSLGRNLGLLHVAGSKSKLPIVSHFKPWNKEASLKVINSCIEKLQEIDSPNSLDFAVLEESFAKKKLVEENILLFEDFNFKSDHLIHGDFLDHNVFFNEAGEVTHIFDFEKTEYAPCVYELIRCMMYSFLSKEITHRELGLAKAYLSAYSEIYPMSSLEIKNGIDFYYIKMIHTMWLVSEAYIQGNKKVVPFLADGIRRFEYLTYHRDDLKKFLTE